MMGKQKKEGSEEEEERFHTGVSVERLYGGIRRPLPRLECPRPRLGRESKFRIEGPIPRIDNLEGGREDALFFGA